MWPILNKNVLLISYLVNVLHHLVVKKDWYYTKVQLISNLPSLVILSTRYINVQDMKS